MLILNKLIHRIYKLATHNIKLCQRNTKGQTPSFQRLSLYVCIISYAYFIHIRNHAFSYNFMNEIFVILKKHFLCMKKVWCAKDYIIYEIPAVIYSIIYYKTQRLEIPIIIHSMNNLFAFLNWYCFIEVESRKS